MTAKTLPGGTFAMAGDLTVTRMGYGAMQLAGPGVFGPPRDRGAAVAVLREAVELGWPCRRRTWPSWTASGREPGDSEVSGA